jgi:Fic family protein
MEEMLVELNARRRIIHTVVFAAELYQKFVYIHPFADGNGRVARLLISSIHLTDRKIVY